MELRPPTPTDQPVTCGTCFWSALQVLDDDEPTLSCHRYPPQIVADVDVAGELVAVQVWPQMASDDFCGEGAPSGDDQ